MTNTLKVVKKGFTIAVTGATILWSVGIAGLAPVATQAAQAGDLIKMDGNSSVYYYGSDGKRYVFPNQTTYNTWYPDFSAVQTISQSELQALPIGGNVTMRAGTYLVKITTDPKVYAVEPGGVLRWVQNETIAQALYGDSWASVVRDVPDAFFVNYTIGSDITTNSYPTGSLISNGGKNYYVDNGSAREITDAGFTANNFQSGFVFPADDTIFGGLGTDPQIAALDTSIWNVAGSTTTATGTGLTVSVASDTPASGIHASGTAYNPALKLNLTASADGSVDVTSLTLKRAGVSVDSNIAGVAVFDANGVRHGNFVTFSDTLATLTFTGDPITVPAGQTVSVMVKTNITAHTSAATPSTAPNSGTYALSVVSSSDIGTTATVSGAFPLSGSGFSYISGWGIVGSATVDAVQVHVNGTNDATVVNINLGTTDQVFGKFRIAAGAPEDISVTSVTLYNNGNANDGDITNIDLVAPDGTILGTLSQTTDRYATFDLSTNPYVIPKGNTRDLTVRGDVVDGSTRTVRFLVYNDYDVIAVGNDTGSAVLPTVAGGTPIDAAFPIGDVSGANTSTCTTAIPCINKITIASGTLLFAKAGDSPSGNIAAGANNVVFGKWELTAQGEDQELQSIAYTPTYSSAVFSGTLYVKVNGTTVLTRTVTSGALPEATTVSSGTVTLSSYYTLKAGQKAVVTIEGSILSTATSGSTISFQLNPITVKLLSTNSLQTAATTLTAGNTLTVSTAALSVAKNSSFANPTIVAGLAEAKVGSFNVTASSTEPVTVSSITVGITTNAGGLSNLLLKDGSTQIGTTVTSPATSNVFSITGFTVPAGTTKTIDVYLTTNSTATGTDSVTITAVSATGQNSSTTVTTTGLTATGQTIIFSSGGTLTIARDGTNMPVAQILHSGLVDQTLLAVRLTSNNAEDIRVTTIQVGATSGATSLQNLKLYYNSSQIGSTTQLNGSTASFSGLSLIVPKDTSITVYIKGSTTSSSSIDSQAVVNLSVDHVEALGVSGGSTLKPGTTLNTAWTATNTSEIGASITVASTVGFHAGDVVLVHDIANAGQLGIVTAEPSSTVAMTVATKGAAVTSGGTGLISKIETGATTAASAGTPTMAGVAVTVTSTKGFSVGDPVLILGASGVELGYVSVVTNSTTMTVRAIANGNTGVASRISKIGTDTLSTAATAGAALITTASTAQAVTSTTGFSVGDLVLVQDTGVAGTYGVVTAIGSALSMSIVVNTAMTTTTSATVVRIGSTNPATTLVTTAGSVGNRALGLTTTTVTSTTGFGAGDAVVTLGTASGGAILGRVGAVASTTSMTIGSIAIDSTAVTRVTRLPGAAAAGNALTIEDVEPIITVNSASPSGATTAGSGQVVGIFDVKASGDRNMNVTSVNVQANGSNLPWNYVTSYDLYNGAQKLAAATPQNYAVGTATAANVLTGTTLYLCWDDTDNTGTTNTGVLYMGVVSGSNSRAIFQQKTVVNDKIVIFASTANYITATVTAISTATTGAGNCNDGTTTNDLTLTLSNSNTTGTAPTGTSATNIKSFNVIFNGNSSTPLSTQSITAGSTLPLTVKADTTSVKTGVTSGTVNYNVRVNGTAGQSNGGLTWGYTPSGGTAITGLTLSDSYPVNAPTLIY